MHSSSSDAWAYLYRTAAWRRMRLKAIALAGGRCQWEGCGVVLLGKQNAPDTGIGHHLIPHRGDKGLFYDPKNIMAVCKACHDGPIQRKEAGSQRIEREDGWSPL